jgi:hypothetical protein
MHFSNHASIRLFERLQLTESQILDDIQKEFYVPIGNDNQRRHLLMYSELDDKPFVAVLNTNTDEIVTILLDNYHNAWRISEETLFDVKNIKDKNIQKDCYSENIKPDYIPQQRKPNPSPSGFKVKLSYYDKFCRVRKLPVGNFSFDKYKCIEHLFNDLEFKQKIKKLIDDMVYFEYQSNVQLQVQIGSMPPVYYKQYVGQTWTRN